MKQKIKEKILVKEYFWITIFSVFLALLFLWPALSHLTTQFIGDGGDNYEYASYMGLTAQAISHGQNPLAHTTYWRYPVGIDFARSYDSILTLSIGTILTLIFGLPLSYNLTIITLMSINGFCSFLFFRFLGKSTKLGILGMVIYGFSFYPLAKAFSHLNLLSIGGFPLFAYTVLRLFSKEKPTRKDYLSVYGSVLFLATASLQYTVLLTICCLVSFAVFYFLYRPVVLRSVLVVKHTITPALQATGIFLVSFCVLFSPQLLSMANGTFEFVGREGTLYEATPGFDNFFFPNTYLHLLISHIGKASSLTSIESAVFLGWAELAVFIAFLFYKKLHKRFRLLLGILFLIPFLFALGYGKENSFPLLPYRFLADFPLFRIIAEPGRYFVVFYLIFTSSIVLYLRYLKSKKTAGTLFVILLALVIFERIPTSIHLTSTRAEDGANAVVRKTTTAAVLDLPLNIYYPVYNVFSLYYQKPIVNGYFHWSADGDSEKAYVGNSGLLARYSCDADDPLLTGDTTDTDEKQADVKMLKNLKANGIHTIVVHKDYKFYHPVCTNVRLRLSRLIPIEQEAKEGMVSHQITLKAFEGKPAFTLYFPKDGMVYLDGVYIAPSKQADFTITSSEGTIIPYSWHHTGSPHAFEMLPKDSIQFQVSRGTTVTFASNQTIPSTFFSIWYRYGVFTDAKTVPFHPTFTKLFEDDKSIVYYLQ